MNITTLLSIAVIGQLGSPLVVAVGDHVPKLNVEASCKGSVEADEAMRLNERQSYGSCMNDETSAQQQLASIWSSTPGLLRDRCEGEAKAGGFDSYVDLLTCIQMATDWAKANTSSPTPALRGASRKRNQN